LILEILAFNNFYQEMICFPNAKINIGLNITSKRNDGFHEIESVFYPIKSLYDVLEVIENKDDDKVYFNATGIEIPGNSHDNLCLKAYDLIQQYVKVPPIRIHLHKNIPIGAGMGGGSSDAAFFVKLMNDKFELNLTDNIMFDIVTKLGSDCAFFLNNKSSYVTGRGEIIEQIDFTLSNKKIVVIYPNIHISTRDAYAGVLPIKPQRNLLQDISQPIEDWKHTIKNDFESTIFLQYPELAFIKEQLYMYGAQYACMSGSGSTIFGIFDRMIDTAAIKFDYDFKTYSLE